MRLINTKTFELETFTERTRPPYAILSHMWGNDEISFQEMQSQSATTRGKSGFVKIRQSARIALKNGYKYLWVDTCCIDKTSSAELQESINSMFRWYKEAEVCYAYLADVPAPPQSRHPFTLTDGSVSPEWLDVKQSKWFTRGWTLQELIAPKNIKYFAGNWQSLSSNASRTDIRKLIADITGIPETILISGDASYASIAQIMSWASERQTTRIEDMAYCLMGLFGINMPMLYGEGEMAFIRLQEKIMKASDDLSLFAWKDSASTTSATSYRGLLARSPADFRNCGIVYPFQRHHYLTQKPYRKTNRGISIHFPLYPSRTEPDHYVADLSCFDTNHGPHDGKVGIHLKRLSPEGNQFARIFPGEFERLSDSTLIFYSEPVIEHVYVRNKIDLPCGHITKRLYGFFIRIAPDRDVILCRYWTAASLQDTTALHDLGDGFVPISQASDDTAQCAVIVEYNNWPRQLIFLGFNSLTGKGWSYFALSNRHGSTSSTSPDYAEMASTIFEDSEPIPDKGQDRWLVDMTPEVVNDHMVMAVDIKVNPIYHKRYATKSDIR